MSHVDAASDQARIVVGVDGSAAARAALDWAIRRQGWHGQW